MLLIFAFAERKADLAKAYRRLVATMDGHWLVMHSGDAEVEGDWHVTMTSIATAVSKHLLAERLSAPRNVR